MSRPNATAATKSGWFKSALAGSYVSANGRFTAALQAPGKYDGIKLARHYAIRNVGGTEVMGRPRNLAEAARMFPTWGPVQAPALANASAILAGLR